MTQKHIRLVNVYIVSSAVRSRYFRKDLAARELERKKMDVVQKVNDADVKSHFGTFGTPFNQLPFIVRNLNCFYLHLALAVHLVSRRYGRNLKRYPMSLFPGRHAESTISIRETRYQGMQRQSQATLHLNYLKIPMWGRTHRQR